MINRVAERVVLVAVVVFFLLLVVAVIALRRMNAPTRNRRETDASDRQASSGLRAQPSAQRRCARDNVGTQCGLPETATTPSLITRWQTVGHRLRKFANVFMGAK